MTAPPPIFLQTGFRSGGTWLWSRFRDLPEVLAYCEPLNEALSDITPTGIANLTAGTSRLNHPTLQDPYFIEFLPLLNDTGMGVRHHCSHFGIHGYFGQPAGLEAALAIYVDSLLDHARMQVRQPVLKFTRALGRAKWLRKTFPEAKQILVVRAPLEQFLSGWDLFGKTANVTFLMIPVFIVTRLKTDTVRELCVRFAIPGVTESDELSARIGSCAALARDMSPLSLWAAFLIMFVVGHSHVLGQLDMTIDMSRLTADNEGQIERQLLRISGLCVNLSGHAQRSHTPTSSVTQDEWQEVFDVVCIALAHDHAEAVDFTRRLAIGTDRSRQAIG